MTFEIYESMSALASLSTDQLDPGIVDFTTHVQRQVQATSATTEVLSKEQLLHARGVSITKCHGGFWYQRFRFKQPFVLVYMELLATVVAVIRYPGMRPGCLIVRQGQLQDTYTRSKELEFKLSLPVLSGF